MPDYVCRLVMKVSAVSPSEAPVEFVRYLSEGGLVHWIFRVEDQETQEILGYYDGNGIPIDMEALEDDLTDEDEEQTPVESVELPDFTTDPLEITIDSSATPSDAELLALAESLNETEQL